MYRPQKGATPKVIEELEESASNKVLLIKNSIKQSMRAIKTGKELKNHLQRLQIDLIVYGNIYNLNSLAAYKKIQDNWNL